VSAVADVGGAAVHVEELIKRALKFVLCASLARQYDLTSQRGKRTFGKLRLFGVLCGLYFWLFFGSILLESI